MVRFRNGVTTYAFLACGAVACSPVGAEPLQDAGPTDGNIDEAPYRPPGSDGGDRPAPGSCGLASPAFCETFEDKNSGGRGGELDETVWAVSRWGTLAHQSIPAFSRRAASSLTGYTPTAYFCGGDFADIYVGDDYAICAGKDGAGDTSNQLHEIIRDDGNAFVVNSMMIRQMFDFSPRKGTTFEETAGQIVFDVDAKAVGGHGWWTEVWITEDPVPIPYQEATTVYAPAKNGVGLELKGPNRCGGGHDGTSNRISRVFVTRYHNGKFEEQNWSSSLSATDTISDATCFDTEDGVLNRFRLLLSRDRIELQLDENGTWTSLGFVDGLDLRFSRGFVTFQHAHYNAAKSDPANGGGNTPVQTYRWDNVGFDGPSVRPVRAYDLPYDIRRGSENGFNYASYGIGVGSTAKFSIEGVDLTDALAATLNFNVAAIPRDFEMRVNGGGWFPVEDFANLDAGYRMRAYSVLIPLDDLQDGTNTFEVRNPDPNPHDHVGNVDLTLHL